MQQWARIFFIKGYQVVAEKNITKGVPSIILRIRKDGGEIRSQMPFPLQTSDAPGLELALNARNNTFNALNKEFIAGAIDSMLELEPSLLYGEHHTTIIQSM